MKFVPHNYQRYCINRMITDPVLGLFLDMGLGKTVITLTAVNDLRFNRFAVRKVLVIAPKKVAEDTWTRESQKWDHLKMLRVIPVLGSIKQRIRAINTPGDIWVLSRDNVSWLVDYYKNDWPFDMVIIDELSSFKSNKAKRFRKLKSVRSHIHRIVGLTGTPTPNGLEDLWAQIYLLDEGKRLGKTLTGYRDNYFTPGARNGNVVYEYNPRTWADEEINDLMNIKGYTKKQATNLLYSGGLKVYTTQDSKIQNILDEEYADPSNYPDTVQYELDYALTVTDPDGNQVNYSKEMLQLYFQNEDPDFDLLFDSPEDGQTYVDKYKASILANGSKVLAERVNFAPQPQSSMSVIDQHTGYVKALIGGRGEKTASLTLNRATDTTRQPGSTFKIVSTYAPFEIGGKI